MIPLILLALGFLLIFMEFFVPGAVLGISGGVFIVVGMVLLAMQMQNPWLFTLLVIGVAVGLYYLIKFAMWRIRTAKASHSIYSDDNQEGYFASSYDVSVVGKKGVVVTDLKPGGHILVDGKRLQALSQSGYLSRGSEVLVIGGQEESLIVKHVKKEKDVES